MNDKLYCFNITEEMIDEAIEGWRQSILEELESPYLTETERRELEKELLSVS